MDNQVVLTSFVYEMDAQVLVLELQAAGIEAMVRKDDCGGMRPAITNERGIEVIVSEQDLAQASEIIGQTADQAPADPSEKRGKSSGCLASVITLGIGLAVGYVGAHLISDAQTDYSKTLEVDTNKDGQIDTRYEYDSDGNAVRIVNDSNYDGEWDDWHYYRQGIATLSKHDLDFNGIVDETVEYKSECRFLGVIKPNGSEMFGREQRYNFGILQSEDVDTTGDGTYDTRIKYDPFLTVISKRAL